MIGERIAELRIHQGWSQSKLARMLHLSTKAIKNWETGISDPSAVNLISLANLFSVSSDYLLGIDNDLIKSLSALITAGSLLWMRFYPQIHYTANPYSVQAFCAAVLKNRGIGEDALLLFSLIFLLLLHFHFQ